MSAKVDVPTVRRFANVGWGTVEVCIGERSEFFLPRDPPVRIRRSVSETKLIHLTDHSFMFEVCTMWHEGIRALLSPKVPLWVYHVRSHAVNPEKSPLKASEATQSAEIYRLSF